MAKDATTDSSQLEELVADRIRDDLARVTSASDETSQSRSLSLQDLEALSASWDFTRHPPRTSHSLRSRPAWWIRRLLHRLFFPSLHGQSKFTAATLHALTDIAERLDITRLALREANERLARLSGAESDRERQISLDMLALENRFRGSETETRERQLQYVGYFEHASPVLDVGCGRGEFLTLLSDQGVAAKGIDSDPHVVEYCRTKSLDVTQADALRYLECLDDSTLGGIFSAMTIEHMDSSEVIRLVGLSARKLRRGGVLLLETANPESLLVLAAFYVDFTHVRPYHPLALQWLMEEAGFDQVRLEFSLPLEKPTESQVAAEVETAFPELMHLIHCPRAYAAIGVRS